MGGGGVTLLPHVVLIVVFTLFPLPFRFARCHLDRLPFWLFYRCCRRSFCRAFGSVWLDRYAAVPCTDYVIYHTLLLRLRSHTLFTVVQLGYCSRFLLYHTGPLPHAPTVYIRLLFTVLCYADATLAVRLPPSPPFVHGCRITTHAHIYVDGSGRLFCTRLVLRCWLDAVAGYGLRLVTLLRIVAIAVTHLYGSAGYLRYATRSHTHLWLHLHVYCTLRLCTYPLFTPVRWLLVGLRWLRFPAVNSPPRLVLLRFVPPHPTHICRSHYDTALLLYGWLRLRYTLPQLPTYTHLHVAHTHFTRYPPHTRLQFYATFPHTYLLVPHTICAHLIRPLRLQHFVRLHFTHTHLTPHTTLQQRCVCGYIWLLPRCRCAHYVVQFWRIIPDHAFHLAITFVVATHTPHMPHTATAHTAPGVVFPAYRCVAFTRFALRYDSEFTLRVGDSPYVMRCPVAVLPFTRYVALPLGVRCGSLIACAGLRPLRV